MHNYLHISNICCNFAPTLVIFIGMSVTQMEGLWQYLQTLSLNKTNRQWLAEHLTMPTKTVETPNQKYVRESLTRAIKEVKQAEKAGRVPGRPIEELINR